MKTRFEKRRARRLERIARTFNRRCRDWAGRWIVCGAFRLHSPSIPPHWYPTGLFDTSRSARRAGKARPLSQAQALR